MRRSQIFKFWDRVRASFWFLPVLMASGAVMAALAAVNLDESVTDWLLGAWGWDSTGGAEGAIAVLGTIAGSMITIAGVVFSMTLVALSLASSQLGPRLLRNLMRDTTTQVVLGTFVATFLYCLLVLRTIGPSDEVTRVPLLSVTFGVMLAVVSVGVLIYFIHHVSISIQADETVARISRELNDGIDRLFPERIGREAPAGPDMPPDAHVLDAFGRDARQVLSIGDGYLQFVDGDTLIELAAREDAIFRLQQRPGGYVVAGSPLVAVWPAERVTDQLAKEVNSAIVLGNQRTHGQDIEFTVNLLVEVAVRALSPGMNDPFTAVTCVDRIGSALCRLAQRDMPSAYRHDSQNQLRLISPSVTFDAITDAALDPIRQYGGASVPVTLRLLETIALVAGFTHRPEDRAALLRHARVILRGASSGLLDLDNDDRRAVEECFRGAYQRCNVPTTGAGT